jgi:hypothetical protein
MSIIEDLKSNCKPFGLTSEAAQVKAKEIGRNGFMVYWPDECEDGWEKHKKTSSSANVFVGHMTYRLRPDYAEEPEIVEWPVFFDEKDFALKYRGKLASNFLDIAIRCRDFIGFKYANGEITAAPRMYKSVENSYLTFVVSMGDKIEDFEAVTPTHVLFQVTK